MQTCVYGEKAIMWVLTGIRDVQQRIETNVWGIRSNILFQYFGREKPPIER